LAPVLALNRKRRALRAAVDEVPFWFHSIDLGHGVITPGQKPPEMLTAEWDQLRLGDLEGKTVLDIGAWDGYFSFRAEQAGAARVVALDHYVWSLELSWFSAPEEARRQLYVDNGLDPNIPVLAHEIPGLWDPARLPGQIGFATARRALESGVEPQVGDLMELDLDALGTFDVVLYLGVLYHVEDPLRALRRLRAVTRELAVVETAIAAVPGFEHVELAQFFPGSELDDDPTNWWTPNLKALTGLCRAAGFSDVTVLVGPPPSEQIQGELPHQYRAVVQARP